jgi:hypothetical protein
MEMELSEVIKDLGLDGALSHRDYDSMVRTWKNPNQPIPSYDYCLEIWNTKSVIRIRDQRKLERIREVKGLANEQLLTTDWKVIKHQETEYLTPEQYFDLKAERTAIRNKSNEIETEINNLETLELVNNYIINFE